MSIRLQQDQVWQQGDTFYKIVHWERLFIVYRQLRDPKDRQGPERQVSKKDFCRLIKGAQLVAPRPSQD